MAKKKTIIVCYHCAYKWKTVRQWDAYCPKCGRVNKVNESTRNKKDYGG